MNEKRPEWHEIQSGLSFLLQTRDLEGGKTMCFFRLAVCSMFLAFVCAVSAQAPNTGAKTNADRKTECRNLGGTVVEYGEGGFACNAGSYEATIHCTSGGVCICTGSDCDKLGGGGALGMIGDSKKKIFAAFPRNLSVVNP